MASASVLLLSWKSALHVVAQPSQTEDVHQRWLVAGDGRGRQGDRLICKRPTVMLQ